MLQPLVRADLGDPAPRRLPEGLLFPARSTEYLRSHQKRCVPNRAKWFLALAKIQNCDAWKGQSNPMLSDPPQRDYARWRRDPPPNRARRLMRAYHLAPLLV